MSVELTIGFVFISFALHFVINFLYSHDIIRIWTDYGKIKKMLNRQEIPFEDSLYYDAYNRVRHTLIVKGIAIDFDSKHKILKFDAAIKVVSRGTT